MNIKITSPNSPSHKAFTSNRVETPAIAKREDQAEVDSESFQPSSPPAEFGDLKTMLKRGLSFGAFLGVPAALGAAGNTVGESFQSEIGGFASSAVGATLGQVYSGAKGGQAGWAIVPKKSAGVLLGVVTVPAGVLAGVTVGAVTTLAGGLGGLPAVAALTGIGFAAGMAHGYYEPKVDSF